MSALQPVGVTVVCAYRYSENVWLACRCFSISCMNLRRLNIRCSSAMDVWSLGTNLYPSGHLHHSSLDSHLCGRACILALHVSCLARWYRRTQLMIRWISSDKLPPHLTLSFVSDCGNNQDTQPFTIWAKAYLPQAESLGTHCPPIFCYKPSFTFNYIFSSSSFFFRVKNTEEF